MLTLLINETKPLAGLFASTTGGIGSVPDISVADEGQAVSVQTFTRTAGVITDSFVAGDVLHIGIGDGVNAPVCYIELSSASPATGTMAINTVGMVALFAATSANQLTLNVGVVRTRGGNTNTIFSAPIVIHRSVIDPDTAVPTPSILGTGVAAALKVAINTALGFVRLDASARLPAVDGSQLTNLPNTGGVTSITGTANEITVTGTTTPTLSLPSALTFTGKTVTGGTFTGGAFNGTVGATTPSTVAGTTGTFDSTVTVGANGNAGTLNITNSSGATMSSISGADGSASFANGMVTIDLNGIITADTVHGNSQVSSPLVYVGSVITIGDDFGSAAYIDVDGSAMFGGGGLTITAGGSITADVVSGNQFDAPTVYCDIVNLGRASGTAGTLYVKDSGGTTTATIDGTAGTASFASGGLAIDQWGNITSNSGASVELDYVNAVFELEVGVGGNAGTLNVKNSGGTTTASIDGASGGVVAIQASIGYGQISFGSDIGTNAWINNNGNASFASGALTIDQFGNLNSASEVAAAYTVTVGANGNAGTLNVKNSGGTTTASIEGSDGSASFATGTFTATTSLLLGTAGSAVGTIGFNNATSGTTTLQPATGALGTGTVTLPLSGTLATLEGSNTYTGTTNTFTLPTTTGTTTTSGIAVSGNSLTTGTGIYAASSTLTSGKLLDLQVSGTAAAASQTVLNIATTGANGTSGITTKGAVISNTHTGTTSTNTALELTASGGTTNYALNVTAGAAVFAAGVYFGGLAFADKQLKKGSSGPLVLTSGTNNQLQILACGNIYCGGDLNGGSQSTDLSSTGVTVGSNGFHAWTNTVNQAYQTKDLYASRYAAGVLQIGTSSANDAGSIRLTNITALGTLAVTGASTLTGLITANGGITLGDGQNIAFNTTTGTKIGAATTQKLSFWNATPIVQPTTAVASATVAHAGGGTNIKTDDTFDGYTIAQVVKALRNAGLLA